jgi:hypothetical protein
MMQDDAQTVCVRRVSGEFEAQQVRAFLEANEVPSFMRGEALRNTHALTIDGLGEVEIHVSPEHAERARDLLARADAGDLQIEEPPA